MVFGVGWGSCLAIELGLRAQAAGVGPQACLLIGGCRSRESLPWSYRMKSRLARKLPRFLLKPWAVRHWLVGTRKPISFVRNAEIVKAARIPKGDESAFMVHQSGPQVEADSSGLDASSLIVHQLHGRMDTCCLVPNWKTRRSCCKQASAASSHPEELTRWLDAILRDDQLKREHRHPA